MLGLLSILRSSDVFLQPLAVSRHYSQVEAQSIKYQTIVAELPMAKESADFDFAAAPANELPVREFSTGGLLASQRYAVLKMRMPRDWAWQSEWRAFGTIRYNPLVKA